MRCVRILKSMCFGTLITLLKELTIKWPIKCGTNKISRLFLIEFNHTIIYRYIFVNFILVTCSYSKEYIHIPKGALPIDKLLLGEINQLVVVYLSLSIKVYKLKPCKTLIAIINIQKHNQTFTYTLLRVQFGITANKALKQQVCIGYIKKFNIASYRYTI